MQLSGNHLQSFFVATQPGQLLLSISLVQFKCWENFFSPKTQFVLYFVLLYGRLGMPYVFTRRQQRKENDSNKMAHILPTGCIYFFCSQLYHSHWHNWQLPFDFFLCSMQSHLVSFNLLYFTFIYLFIYSHFISFSNNEQKKIQVCQELRTQ